MQWKLTAVGAVFCLIAGGGLYSEHLAAERAYQEDLDQQHELALSRILPRTPTEMLRSLHTMVGYKGAGDSAKMGCLLMDEPTRAVFARDHGEPTCEAAMIKLGQQVTDINSYVEFTIDDDKWVRSDKTSGSINGCEVEFGGLFDPKVGDPGPRLGQFHAHRILEKGLMIDGYTPCPPRPPDALPQLPGQPGLVADVLIGYLANGNTVACQMFAESGKKEFAESEGAKDCPEAVQKFRAKVTDPNQYAKPIGGSWTGPHDIQDDMAPVPVYVCELVWSPQNRNPGPAKVANLEVARPKPDAGYWITHFRPCQ